MPPAHFDLAASAYKEMLREGFTPDFSRDVLDQVKTLQARATTLFPADYKDLRGLLWSSIDNQSSRDLDQIEHAERVANGIRLRIAIADVDSDVPINSPIDHHAAAETVSVYTPVRIFPMLPEELSTDLTALGADRDRAAVIIEYVVTADGSLAGSDVYRAVVRNKFRLSYEVVGPWLDRNDAFRDGMLASAELAAQLRLQNEAAGLLRAHRHRLGALVFDRLETDIVIRDGQVETVVARKRNTAAELIEDLMIAANAVMARTLHSAGVSNIRRVVKAPERWSRIVAMAADHGTTLPLDPDAGALAGFLRKQKQRDPARYPSLSLSILKLMGPGEYVVERPGDQTDGHFGLAANDYTHATAPNRRFADLVTQRLIKALLSRADPPYSDEQLGKIARDCTLKEDAARKVERTMAKRAAAVAFHNRVGERFEAIVTGVKPSSGVFARVLNAPIEGRIVRGEQGLDVGDRVEVHLVGTDPERGFIDFAR